MFFSTKKSKPPPLVSQPRPVSYTNAGTGSSNLSSAAPSTATGRGQMLPPPSSQPSTNIRGGTSDAADATFAPTFAALDAHRVGDETGSAASATTPADTNKDAVPAGTGGGSTTTGAPPLSEALLRSRRKGRQNLETYQRYALQSIIDRDPSLSAFKYDRNNMDDLQAVYQTSQRIRLQSFMVLVAKMLSKTTLTHLWTKLPRNPVTELVNPHRIQVVVTDTERLSLVNKLTASEKTASTQSIYSSVLYSIAIDSLQLDTLLSNLAGLSTLDADKETTTTPGSTTAPTGGSPQPPTDNETDTTTKSEMGRLETDAITAERRQMNLAAELLQPQQHKLRAGSSPPPPGVALSPTDFEHAFSLAAANTSQSHERRRRQQHQQEEDVMTTTEYPVTGQQRDKSTRASKLTDNDDRFVENNTDSNVVPINRPQVSVVETRPPTAIAPLVISGAVSSSSSASSLSPTTATLQTFVSTSPTIDSPHPGTSTQDRGGHSHSTVIEATFSEKSNDQIRGPARLVDDDYDKNDHDPIGNENTLDPATMDMEVASFDDDDDDNDDDDDTSENAENNADDDNKEGDDDDDEADDADSVDDAAINVFAAQATAALRANNATAARLDVLNHRDDPPLPISSTGTKARPMQGGGKRWNDTSLPLRRVTSSSSSSADALSSTTKGPRTPPIIGTAVTGRKRKISSSSSIHTDDSESRRKNKSQRFIDEMRLYMEDVEKITRPQPNRTPNELLGGIVQ